MTPTHGEIARVTLEFSEKSGTYTATYDQQSTEPSMAIIEAVSSVLDTDPLELDPLFETFDTDALDELLWSVKGCPVHVSFTFAGCDVTMSGGGRIQLSPPDA